MAALVDAKNGGYSVNILAGRVGLFDRTVVLLGDVHTKNEKTAQEVKAVLEEFPFRGLEMIRFNTIVGKIMGLPSILFENFTYLMAYLFEGSKDISTIHLARKDGALRKPDERTEDEIVNIHLEHGSYDVISASGINLAAAVMVNDVMSPFLLTLGSCWVLRKGLFPSLTFGALETWLLTQSYGEMNNNEHLWKTGMEFEGVTRHPVIFHLTYFLQAYRPTGMRKWFAI